MPIPTSRSSACTPSWKEGVQPPRGECDGVAATVGHSSSIKGVQRSHGALSQVTVSRLKESWAKIDAKAKSTFAELETLMTPIGNFKVYRNELRKVLDEETSPVLPYIGTFLRDVLVANDGNPDTLKGSKEIINWDKMQIIGNQINYFNRFKKHRFQFAPNVELRDLLYSLPASYEANEA